MFGVCFVGGWLRVLLSLYSKCYIVVGCSLCRFRSIHDAHMTNMWNVPTVTILIGAKNKYWIRISKRGCLGVFSQTVAFLEVDGIRGWIYTYTPDAPCGEYLPTCSPWMWLLFSPNLGKESIHGAFGHIFWSNYSDLTQKWWFSKVIQENLGWWNIISIWPARYIGMLPLPVRSSPLGELYVLFRRRDPKLKL